MVQNGAGNNWVRADREVLHKPPNASMARAVDRRTWPGVTPIDHLRTVPSPTFIFESLQNSLAEFGRQVQAEIHRPTDRGKYRHK